MIKTEVELGRAVVAYLRDLGWEVYQEIQARAADGVADVVAIQRGVVWVVECKMNLSLALLDQIHRWRGRAHLRAVAVPSCGARRVVEYFLRAEGIGLLCASSRDRYSADWRRVEGTDYSVDERIPPRLVRRAGTGWTSKLTEAHKTYAEAGNNIGRRLTPFKETCEQVHRYVSEHPGCSLQELIGAVGKAHYASASSARVHLAHWILDGKVDGVVGERVDGRLTLRPRGE